MSSLSALTRFAGTTSIFVLAITTAAACGGGEAKSPVVTAPAPTVASAPAPMPINTTPHPFGFDDMIAMDRIEGLTVSPDGKQVAFTVKTPDLAANRSRTDIWLAGIDGSGVRRLTDHPDADHSPSFSPDGKSVHFLSAREGGTQVWRVPVAGGPAAKMTASPVDVEGFMMFPDGKRMLLVLDVYPDAATLEESAKRDQTKEKNPSKVRAYDALPIRHWDAWDEGKRNHIFVVQDGKAPVDLLKGMSEDAPTKPFGGTDDIAISKDGTEVVFASKMVGRQAAWSTNTDIWVVPADGSQKPKSISEKSLGEDTHPVFSPDGSQLAYFSMARAGYESDRRRVVLVDWKTKKERVLTEAWDRSPASLAWAPDGKTIFASADHVGQHAIFSIAVADGKATAWPVEGTNQAVTVAGDKLVWLHDTLRSPAEVWTADLEGKEPHAVTHLNDARVKPILWGEPEQFSFTGAKGDKVYAWLVKPSELKAGAKAPVAMLVHGGPQGSFGNHFHYRWNPEIYAGHGFATIMVDFHGSTGYGQAFTDAIRGDWGGAPYDDIMKGLDAALAKYTFLDGTRTVALGASYGGFMINWINGKTDRFKALVCHDGNLDEVMAYYETEELWFPEWEHGKTPWENPAGYQKHDPRDLVKNWKTPTLVVHGGRDFRVVDTQGMATFTALQRRGVESRFVHFPDENHWVLKPANSKRWHQEVLAWIDRFTAPK